MAVAQPITARAAQKAAVRKALAVRKPQAMAVKAAQAAAHWAMALLAFRREMQLIQAII